MRPPPAGAAGSALAQSGDGAAPRSSGDEELEVVVDEDELMDE
jgi:hypothetical protein